MLYKLPEILIVSTQRSGTHLLQSFLENHPRINGNGELFLRLERTGQFRSNMEGKANIGILMYNQMYIFKRLGGNLKNHKIIHLLRDPYYVALSRLKLGADKLKFGPNYKAHYYSNEDPEVLSRVRSSHKLIEPGKLDLEIESIIKQQQEYKELLKNIPHLEVYYEQFVPENKNVIILNEFVKARLSTYLNINFGSDDLTTNYIKI